MRQAGATAGDGWLDEALGRPLLSGISDEQPADVDRQGRADPWLAAAGGGLALWALFWPHPYVPAMLAVGAVLPLLAMGAVAWRLQGWRWRLDAWGSVGLGVAAVAPAMALAIRASRDVEMVWPWTPLPLALGAAVIAAMVTGLTMLPGRLRRRSRGAKLGPVAGVALALAVASGCWTWGALIFENAWGPGQGAAETVSLIVIGHDPADETGEPTLSLAPWRALQTPEAARRLSLAGRPAQEAVAVDVETWMAARRGEAVCAYLSQGARGWPTVDYRPCPPAKPWRR